MPLLPIPATPILSSPFSKKMGRTERQDIMNLTGKPFNPGELRTKVLFQTATIAKDAGGAQSLTYADLDSPRVKWVNAHGQEQVASDAMKSVQRATVTRRYNVSVTEVASIVKDGERWQVISVDDIQLRHEYMELVVERAKGTV
jgi:SPP1 family predicted phage head-tail adaptor